MLASCFREGLVSPRIPVDGIGGVLKKVGTLLCCQAIGHMTIVQASGFGLQASGVVTFPAMSAEQVLAGKRVAMLVEEGFEDRELMEPLTSLREAGAQVTVIGPAAGAEYRGKRGEAVVKSDLAAGAAKVKDFDALVIPGGQAPEKMRMRHAMVDFTRDVVAAGKPVAAICHGPQLLISVNALRGRTLTCWPAIAIDVKNAGGLYVDKPVVEDGNLITSRKPDDVPVFVEAIVKALTRVQV